MGLKLNDKKPLGELGARVIGFRFELVSQALDPLPELRVNFPMSESDEDPYLEQFDPSQATDFFVSFEVGEAPTMIYPLSGRPAKGFVPADVLDIQFHVPTKPPDPIVFNFCIKNLTAIMRP